MLDNNNELAILIFKSLGCHACDCQSGVIIKIDEMSSLLTFCKTLPIKLNGGWPFIVGDTFVIAPFANRLVNSV